MENEFNFNEFVENLVLEAIRTSPNLDERLRQIEDQVEDSVDCLNNDVENLDERLGKLEDDTSGLDYLDERVANLEDNSANFSEVEDVEKDVEDLQERLAKMEELFLPLLPVLEALQKAKSIPIKKPLPAPRRERFIPEEPRAGLGSNWNR